MRGRESERKRVRERERWIERGRKLGGPIKNSYQLDKVSRDKMVFTKVTSKAGVKQRTKKEKLNTKKHLISLSLFLHLPLVHLRISKSSI